MRVSPHLCAYALSIRTRGEQGGDRPRDEEHALELFDARRRRGVPVDDALTVGVIGPIGSSRVRALGRHDDEERLALKYSWRQRSSAGIGQPSHRMREVRHSFECLEVGVQK